MERKVNYAKATSIVESLLLLNHVFKQDQLHWCHTENNCDDDNEPNIFEKS